MRDYKLPGKLDGIIYVCSVLSYLAIAMTAPPDIAGPLPMVTIFASIFLVGLRDTL